MSKKIITGVKPTGSSMHLGNLMGAVLPFEQASRWNDAAIFIADLHALTSVKDGKTMQDQSFELAVEYFAIFGIDTPIKIFRQSDIVDITKLMWILTNVTPYSLMNRAHSFKDFQQRKEEIICNLWYAEWSLESYDIWMNAWFINLTEKNKQTQELKRIELENRTLEVKKELSDFIMGFENNLNMWVFNYPILMAADIIGYDCEAVPVGKDQIQHLEMTRDIVRAFNKTYGQEVFIEPEAMIAEEVATLPGVDGRKMSKSYDNFIGVFDDEKTLKKRVMSIVSGSEWVDERKKNPDECNIFNLYRVFASPAQISELRKKYESENIGFWYGHAKTELLTVLTEYLRPYREAREKLLGNPELVHKKLRLGAIEMNVRLDAKMKIVKEVVGVN